MVHIGAGALRMAYISTLINKAHSSACKPIGQFASDLLAVSKRALRGGVEAELAEIVSKTGWGRRIIWSRHSTKKTIRRPPKPKPLPSSPSDTTLSSMSNCPHVCLEHRYVAKADKWVIRRCPVDGAQLIKYSPRTKIPKKADDLGWARLRASYRQGQRRRSIEDYARLTGQNPHMFYWGMRRAERLLERWR